MWVIMRLMVVMVLNLGFSGIFVFAGNILEINKSDIPLFKCFDWKGPLCQYQEISVSIFVAWLIWLQTLDSHYHVEL